jgi:Flp pilus assembly protein TadD
MRRCTWILLPAVLALACATAKKPDVAAAQRGLARELLKRGDLPAAFAAADAAVRAHPDDADALAIRGTIYRDQGLRAEAKADLEEAVRLQPDHAGAHSALAVLLEGAGESEASLAHHRRAAELEPRNAGYLNNLAFSLFVRGKPRDAIPVYHEALRASPFDARIRNNLGFAYAAAGDFASAAEQFERGGSPAYAKNNLGYAYERRGSAGQAFDSYVEAVRLDPGLQIARQNLERVSRQTRRDLPSDLPQPPSSQEKGKS